MTYIIVDLEATCWPKGTTPQRQEVIEIGAVSMPQTTLSIESDFMTFVQPINEPMLSEFCTALTSITQAQVDSAPTFPDAFTKFLQWVGPQPTILCSWGYYDYKQLKIECKRHNLPFPQRFQAHLNIKKAFAHLQNIRPCGMKQALQLLNLPLSGTHHRGIDDAHNIAKIAQLIFPQLDWDSLPHEIMMPLSHS